MALDPPVVESAYFMRRLAATRRAKELSASMQFDLARSPFSDDELEEYVAAFGGDTGKSGWGLAEGFDRLLTSQPKQVPVQDIAQLQTNLISLGYANPDAEPSGVWSPEWNANMRRFDRDNTEEQFAGKHFLAVPFQRAIAQISNTIPSRVLSGIIGVSKGVVEQTPETLERLGAVGGAAAGAAIGTTIMPGAGTVVGGVVGGVAGFLADIFGDDKTEEGQSDVWSVLDPLVPNEWFDKGGSKKFFEDLGWVASAASMVGGAKLAYQGVKAGVTAAHTVQAAGAVTGQQVPMLQAALTRRAVETPGWFSRIVGWGISKTPNGANTASRWLGFWRTHGLMAQTTRPVLRTAIGAYTGATAGTFGARLAAGFGSGDTETTIEKSIRDTDAVVAHQVAPFVDWAGWIIYPERFLPFKAAGLSKGVQTLLGDHNLKPYIDAYQQATGASVRKSRGDVLELLGRTPDEQATMNTYLRLDFGIHQEAVRRMHIKGFKGPEPKAQGTYEQFRATVVREIKDQAEEGSDSLVKQLLTFSMDNPTDPMKGAGWFTKWLVEMGPRGRGVTKLSDYRKVLDLNSGVQSRVLEGSLSAHVAGQLKKGDSAAFAMQEATGLPMLSETEQLARESVSPLRIRRTGAMARREHADDIVRVEREMREAQTMARQATDPAEALKWDGRVAELKGALKQLKKVEPPPGEQKITELTITPARIDTPTQSTLTAELDEVRRLHNAYKAARKGGEEGPLDLAQEALTSKLEDLREADILPQELVADALGAGTTATFGTGVMKRVTNYLKERSRHVARDVELPDEIMQQYGALGYKPVSTGEEVLFPNQLEQMTELLGPGRYTRRAAVFETLGLSTRWQADRSIFALRGGHEIASLHDELARAGVKLTGEQAFDTLYEKLRAMNHPAVLSYPGQKVQGEALSTFGPFVKGATGGFRGWRLYKVDVRQLTPQDILEAFTQAKVRGVDMDVANRLYGALKRGAAYGGEVAMRHPVASARSLGRAMRISGLPGFSDWVRTAHIDFPGRKGGAALKGAAIGAGAGAGAAAVEGEDILGGAARGAAVGAIAGPAAKKFAYGYLPDHLVRLNSALRYTLSATFDAGRYSEQNMIAMAKFGLPGFLNPKKYISKQGSLRSVYNPAQRVAGEDAWGEALQYWDEINGTTWFQKLDDIDRNMYQAGVLGFSPRNWEAAQAYLLAQRGWSKERVRQAVSEIGRYGLGRRGIEKSANFVFFPFSFSKKLLTSLGDFVLQAPARNLLIHEGMRRWYTLELGDKTASKWFHDFMERHAPLLEQLKRINNLVYGVSPGRFFLQDVFKDEAGRDRTLTGKVAATLAAFFVPSGAATPFAQAMGEAGDLAVQGFVPIVVTGAGFKEAGGVEGLAQIMQRYIPMVREVQDYFSGRNGFPGALAEQYAVLTDPSHIAPFVQFQEYNDSIREEKESLSAISTALGYASVDSFLQSDLGAGFAEEMDKRELELGNKYPTGFRMTTEFTNTAKLDEKALYDLASKDDPSIAEQIILSLTEQRDSWKQVGDLLGLPAETISSIAAKEIRSTALRHVKNPEFALLYERFFARDYGPIRRVA